MIEAEVFNDNDDLIMSRTYHGPTDTLDDVLDRIQKYIVSEGINQYGEVRIRCRFSKLSGQNWAPFNT